MTHRRILAPVVLAASLALTACGGGNDGGDESTEAPAPEETAVSSEQTSATTTPAETSSSEAAASSSATATSSGKAKGAGTGASTSESSDEMDETVAEVAETFSALAPETLFAQLETCAATGVSGSYDCSGAEIGQFQFFDSEAKAASTTQLLTELRSSRIVEDNGDRIVGWSTLGTSAIITVVDNEHGQVLQQLVSTEQEDPRERIGKLGLADVEATGDTATGSPASTTRTSAAATTTQR